MFQMQTEIDDNLIGWSPQKVSNVHCMIQVVRALVAPSCPAQVFINNTKLVKNYNIIIILLYFNLYTYFKALTASQNKMKACGLLQALCNILMASGVPADVLTEMINAVAEVIRGNTINQEYLSSVMAPSTPPRYYKLII